MEEGVRELKATQVRRMKELEKENARLRKAVSELTLGHAAPDGERSLLLGARSTTHVALRRVVQASAIFSRDASTPAVRACTITPGKDSPEGSTLRGVASTRSDRM